MMRFSFLYCLLAIACIPARSLAHDPYELTATASLFSDRTELQLEMELKTGLLLAGQSAAVSNGDTESLFKGALPSLKATAEKFFSIAAGSNQLSATNVSVVLGVENHVQFKLTFAPAAERPLRFAASGLQGLFGQGPYGVTLTVLDMVNKKVIGQSVLFADAPIADLGALPAAPAQIIKLDPKQIAGAQPRSADFQEREASRRLGTVSQASSLPPVHTSNPPTKNRAQNLALLATLAALFALALFWARNRSRRKEPAL